MDEIGKVAGEWIANNIPLSVGITVFVFCVFFEVSKIKIYPIKWLLKLISWPIRKIDELRTESFKHIVEDLKADIDKQLSGMAEKTTENCNTLKGRFDNLEKRFDKLDDKQTETEERIDKLAAARVKNHVLTFSRRCRNGEKHSREDFANLFRENEMYEELVRKYNWKNDVYVEDYKFIKEVYQRCLRENDFLA